MLELYGPGYAQTWKSLYDLFGLDFQSSLDLTQPDENRYPDLVKQSQRARNILARQAQDLMDAGLAPNEPLLVGYALWSASHGVCVLHLAGKYPNVKECRQAFQATMRWLFQGFASQRRRESRTTPRTKGTLHAIAQA